VLVHGWPDTQQLWQRQVEALRPHYRCIRLTLPGFAPGSADCAFSLDEVIDAIGHAVDLAGRPVTLLLHDWGCFFGYQYAVRYPQHVRRVVGVDVGDAGSRRHRAETGWLSKLALVGYQVWLALAWRLGGRLGDAMARNMARLLGAPTDPASIHAAMCYPYAVQWFGVAGGYRNLRAFRPHCPMLFVYGERKPAMLHSKAWMQQVAAAPGSRVQAFDSGHWVMVERSDDFNRLLLDWLQGGEANHG